ncbi:MAG TPA: type I DNA topoisomerase [Polyangia bacterium]|jgi:DNA topoisomerase-1
MPNQLETLPDDETAGEQTPAAEDGPAKKPARKRRPKSSDGDGAEKTNKLHSLVVVESPAKARTIKKYLGAAYVVKASVGHVKDLPKSKMGVDVEHDFQPEYEVIVGKKKVIGEIKKAAKEADHVFLAADPDREGEAIAWHIADEIRDANSSISRVLLHEITKKGVTEALAAPTSLDEKKFESQQARRILDRLVGYEISPILWKKVKRGLSAGRVQSVAVRIVVERERETLAFKPVEYWSIAADLEPEAHPGALLTAKLFKSDGQKVDLKDGAQTEQVANELKAAAYRVSQIERKERRRFPLPPFITSRLQQEAARKLRFTAKRTMGLAQRLYEGLDLEGEGPVGLITYMRTDAVRLSDDAVAEARAYIAERYGAESVPEEPVVYKSRKGSQGAHEAIRPTSMKYDPETVRRLLKTAKTKREEGEHEELYRLYQLIWNRFIACQMKPAVYDQTTIDVGAGRHTLRATGQVLKFAGYTAVYNESPEETRDGNGNGNGATGNGAPANGAGEASGAGGAAGGGDEAAQAAESEDRLLPDLSEGEALRLVKLSPEQHFTQPPPRFTEASLVKELEEKGIGRPSTYATILSTIQDRGYVEKADGGRFKPTELGTLVNDLLVESFPDILNVDFTAQMEESLDQVEEGAVNWVALLKRFYQPFKVDLAQAAVQMRDVKREEIPTEHVCEKCGAPMVIKWGKNGKFLACSGYPACKNTKEFTRLADGTIEIMAEPTTDEVCADCGAPMVVKRGRFGEFLACSRYPECKATRPISLGVACPREGCGGFIAEKRSRRGKSFYGCSNYAKTSCDFVLWDRPVPQPCPQCGAKFLTKKVTRQGTRLRCVTEGCGYSADLDAPEPVAPQPSGPTDAPAEPPA